MRFNSSKRRIWWGKALFCASLSLIFILYPLTPVFADDGTPPPATPAPVVSNPTEPPAQPDSGSTSAPDVRSGIDATQAPVATSDVASSTEALPTQEPVATSDIATVTEAPATQAPIETSDVATSTEPSATQAPIATSDTTTATESSAIQETVVASDTTTATEPSATQAPIVPSEPVTAPQPDATPEPVSNSDVGTAPESKNTTEPLAASSATPEPDAILASASTDIPTPEATASILVQYDAGTSQDDLSKALSQLGAVVSSNLSQINYLVLNVLQSNFESALQALTNLPGVLLANPDGEMSLTDTIPNDPSFSTQYGLTAIHAPQGWDISTGSSAVTIAIVDSGVDLTHPDLTGKFVPGFDFVNNDTDPTDDNGHGTHVAGIAAAVTDNSTGVAGVDWGAQLMPVKVLNAAGSGTFDNVANGIIWATDHGAQVINLSLGGANDSPILQSAIQYAYSHNVVVVAAAGNSSSNVLYPAAYPQAIAVAASDELNNWANFSNFGPQVDVTAPGVNIYSTALGGGYETRSGTSMSAAFVTGEAAILIGMHSNLTPAEVANLIETSALDIGASGVDDQTGHGLVQLDSAIVLLMQTPVPDAGTTSGEPSPRKEKAHPASTSSGSPSPIPTSPSVTPSEPDVVALSNSSSSTSAASPTPTPTQILPSASSTNAGVTNLGGSFIIGALMAFVVILVFFWFRRRRTAP